MTRIRLVGRARGGRCVFCHDELEGDVERCPECRAAWHEDCRPSDGHCHTLGCTAPAPLPARRPGQVRLASPPPRPQTPDRFGPQPRPERPVPEWAIRRRQPGRTPGWSARLGPYSRLLASALLHSALALSILTGLVVGLFRFDAVWDSFVKGGSDGPNGPFVALLMVGTCLLMAFGGLAWSGAWLRSLPGVLSELHGLLEHTTPVLMDLTIEKETDDDSTSWYAHLRGRHGEYAGQEHRWKLGGLLPPWWLTSFARHREPVLVYGLPPPGPYVLELESGALALLHPD